LNGKHYTKNYLTHGDLMNGAKIEFIMSPTPNKIRGIHKSDFPYSFSNEK
jgi:putative alpha-1,2-mannosidase